MSTPRHNLDQLFVRTPLYAQDPSRPPPRHCRVPSAVTYAIRNLEDSLNRIFERQGRRSVLTQAGQRVLERARSVLGEARSLDRLADELGGEWEPTVHVVADAALPITSIVSGIQRFLDRNLPTRVRLDMNVGMVFWNDSIEIMRADDHFGLRSSWAPSH